VEIIIRNVGKHKDVTIKANNTEIYLGMYNKAEAARLAYIFEEASDELVSE